MPSRRLEDKIGELCQRAISAENNDEALPILEELRTALRAHAERLRKVASKRLAAGLPVKERRQEAHQELDKRDG